MGTDSLLPLLDVKGTAVFDDNVFQPWRLKQAVIREKT